MASQQTYRMTLFKVPGEEDQNKLLDLYKAMPQKATKVPILPSSLISFATTEQC